MINRIRAWRRRRRANRLLANITRKMAAALTQQQQRPNCRVVTEDGDPICVRTIEQPPCTPCPDPPAEDILDNPPAQLPTHDQIRQRRGPRPGDPGMCTYPTS